MSKFNQVKKYLIITVIVISLTAIYAYADPVEDSSIPRSPPSKVFTDMAKVETGSTEWWDIIKLSEHTARQKLARLTVKDPNYLYLKDRINYIQTQKCIVGRMYGLSKNSSEFIELEKELEELNKVRRKANQAHNVNKE